MSDPSPAVKHYFVDEAGDSILFSGSGKVLIGSAGCSRYFAVGLLDVPDAAALAADLDKLRADLLADPYFKDVPSMQPKAKKTAFYFHAKDDLPEVRREVFKLLQRHPIRFSAVIRDKKAVLDYVRSRNERDATYRYRADELYDYAVRRLFTERLHKHDGYNICFAIRGNSHRTAAFRQALEQARDRFARERGLTVTSQLNVKAAYPTTELALQAVDYFLWALQRTYEKREDRFLELVWPQCSLVVDVDDTREAEYGTYYTKQKPLKTAALKAG
jgi:hypothetical protein